MGGAEYLMIRTANLLSNAGYDVAIIDIRNGWLSKNINNPLIEKKTVSFNKIKLEDTDILVTTANYMYKLDSFFSRSNTKILLWVVQPYNVILIPPPVFKKNSFIDLYVKNYLSKKETIHKKNLLSIIKRNGLIAMDGECDNTFFETYKMNYKDFLPVFINLEENKKTEGRNISNNTINAVWLGRIDLDFKIHVLKKVLTDINITDLSHKNIIMNIIGDGPGLNSLKVFCEKNIGISVNFLGELSGEALNEAINLSDIGFAMGTSALDISARKIPTVLLDFSYNEINNYKYRWIYESEKYTLGRDIKFLSEDQIDSMKSINSILSELEKDFSDISQLCFDYVYYNHSQKNILIQFENLILKNQFTMNDIYGYRSTKPFWNYISPLLIKLRN